MSYYDRNVEKLAKAVTEKISEPVQAGAILMTRGGIWKEPLKQGAGSLLPNGLIAGAIEGAVGAVVGMGADAARNSMENALQKRHQVKLPTYSYVYVTPTRFGVYGLRQGFSGQVLASAVLIAPRSLVTQVEVRKVGVVFGQIDIALGDNRDIKADYHRQGVTQVESLRAALSQIGPTPR